jgi:hypothetical protein
MTKMSSLLLFSALLLPALALGDDGKGVHKLKPLETWGIKTSDYQKVAKHWEKDKFYQDVPPPNCEKPVRRSMKLLCSREDFQKIAWYARKFYIYAEENAQRTELDHKTAYAGLYQSKCKSEACLGHELKEDLYDSLDNAGMDYILEDSDNN